MEVRDYELDMQGVVNNAVYQNYIEHARHLFLKASGLDFAEITRSGIHLVVTRVELDYLAPLKSGDRFVVTVAMEQISRLRWGFRQEILRQPESKPMLRALVVGTSLDERGRAHLPTEIEELLKASVTDS